MREFSGKVAVVTGAASGIGRGLVQRFVEEGMRVVLADVEASALDAAVQELRRDGFDVAGVVTDVASATAVEQLAREAVDRYGGVHVLCNNAGVWDPGGRSQPLWTFSLDDWTWMLGVNLWGVVHGIRTFAPIMLQQGEPGHIVNTASGAGLVVGGGIYGATKHAVVSISESLYIQLRRQETQVSASVLCPGPVQTRIAESERNRPAALRATAASVQAPEHATARVRATERIQQGMAPQAVAQHVWEAIRDDRFYILPDPVVDAAVRARFERILAGGNPEPMRAQ